MYLQHNLPLWRPAKSLEDVLGNNCLVAVLIVKFVQVLIRQKNFREEDHLDKDQLNSKYLIIDQHLVADKLLMEYTIKFIIEGLVI